jgi:zinc and cadmium transporter
MLIELIVSLAVISLASLIGALTIGLSRIKIESYLEFMVAFAIGALLGDVFVHILPELAKTGLETTISATILFGMICFFILEKYIHWHHCHHASHGKKCDSFGYVSLAGDAFHNFIDGAILAGAFLVSPIIGFSTALAILLHELPQEIGDYAVLLSAGFNKRKALLFNFLISLTAFIGAGTALIFSELINGATPYILAFAAGGFLYLAGTDLLPQLHNHLSKKKAVLQLFFILLGAAVMFSLLLIE